MDTREGTALMCHDRDVSKSGFLHNPFSITYYKLIKDHACLSSRSCELYSFLLVNRSKFLVLILYYAPASNNILYILNEYRNFFF